MAVVCNIGSLNLDIVYGVPHIVRPGETLASGGRIVHPGGKGANQSVALARAGATVRHCGAVGEDGDLLLAALVESGVDGSAVLRCPGPSGHAVIQVADDGENSIVLHAGANHAIPVSHIAASIAALPEDAVVLLQNETCHIATAIDLAQARGLAVWFNPAPFTAAVLDLPLDRIAVLVVNQHEAAGLAASSPTEDPIVLTAALRQRWPAVTIVLTLGADGVLVDGPDAHHRIAAVAVVPVDTTAAGDTFLGYCLARRLAGDSWPEAAAIACHAAALAVTRPGAIPSIPWAQDLIA